MIVELTVEHVPHMMRLQQHCLGRGDSFTPTSERGYALSFQFQNFCLGVWNEQGDELDAFLNCSIPTAKASRNFGRGRIDDSLLDRVGHMNTLLVRSGRRGKGIGKTLVQAGIERLRARSVSYIYAVANPNNVISRNMLLSFGFVETERIELIGIPKVLFLLTD